jgi:uncharacterized membrane protein YwaF
VAGRAATARRAPAAPAATAVLEPAISPATSPAPVVAAVRAAPATDNPGPTDNGICRSQGHWAFALTYFWGLVLSSQALITPDIGTPEEGAPDFPHHLFVTFLTLHVLVVWAAIYLTWGRGMRPRWRDYRLAIVATLAWAAITFTFNVIAGTNYGYLNRKPPTASLLDVLGPWPLYVLAETTIVLIVWALMTWPSQRTRRRSNESPQVV